MKSAWGDMKSLETPVPEEAYTLPLGKAPVRRRGSDVTVVATLLMVHKCLRVAEDLAPQGIEMEAIGLTRHGGMAGGQGSTMVFGASPLLPDGRNRGEL